MRVRTEAKREAIVDAARLLFLEMGYERATMDELTRRIGGSKATLYGYFPSKQELFVAVTEGMAETHLAGALAELEGLAQVGLELGLTRFAHRMMLLMMEDEALALYRIISAESGRSEVGEIFVELGPQRAANAIAVALRGAMDSGLMQAGPADLLALQFLALVRAELELRHFLRKPPRLKPAQVQAMARRAVQLFFGGYRAVGAA